MPTERGYAQEGIDWTASREPATPHRGKIERTTGGYNLQIQQDKLGLTKKIPPPTGTLSTPTIAIYKSQRSANRESHMELSPSTKKRNKSRPTNSPNSNSHRQTHPTGRVTTLWRRESPLQSKPDTNTRREEANPCSTLG